MAEIDPLLAEELWRRAELRWLLRTYQQEFYDHVWAFLRKDAATLARLSGGRADVQSWRTLFEDCHRRYGKSFVLFTIGTEIGLGKPCRDWELTRRVVRFAAPTMLDLEEIYHPIAEDLFESCPDDLRPTWCATRGRGHYLFPSTEAQLHLFGVDAKHYRKARGKKCHLGVVDEAGACEPGHPEGIEHVVKSILLPQTFGIDGCIVLATTPSETPGHPSSLLKAECESRGTYFRRTLYDTAHYFGEDVVDEYARECGGKESTKFRREYGVEWVVEESKAAVPEFSAHEKAIVRPFEPAEWFFPLVSMDPGFGDWHAILFGYWNFERACLDIQAESYHQRTTTTPIAEAVKATEARIWPWAATEMDHTEGGTWRVDPWRPQRRNVRRWSDTDARLIADLGKDHALGFSPTPKDDKEAQVNELRRFINDERVRIDPHCERLIYDLKTTIWNNARTEWERTADGHHGDGVDALIYMLRNAPRNENPTPPKYGNIDATKFFVPDEPEEANPGPWAAVFGGGGHA